MKRTFLIGVALTAGILGACSDDDDPVAPAQLPVFGSLDLPSNAATTEGTSDDGSPFTTARRFQAAYGSALLSNMPSGAKIVGMSIRLESGSSAFTAETISNFEVRLSTPKNAPGALSTTFADNRGNDEVIVRTGPLVIEPADYPTGATPNGFGKMIAFDTQFVYQGGDLMLEVGTEGLAGGNQRRTDAFFPTNLATQACYGFVNGSSATTADIGHFNTIMVIQYHYIEP